MREWLAKDRGWRDLFRNDHPPTKAAVVLGQITGVVSFAVLAGFFVAYVTTEGTPQWVVHLLDQGDALLNVLFTRRG